MPENLIPVSFELPGSRFLDVRMLAVPRAGEFVNLWEDGNTYRVKAVIWCVGASLLRAIVKLELPVA